MTRCGSWGPPCPKCKVDGDLLSTTNEWKYYCPDCDIRYNEKGEIFGAQHYTSEGLANKIFNELWDLKMKLRSVL